MKVSELTVAVVKDYCGISDNDSNDIIGIEMTAAKSYIKGYTELTDEEIDEHEDLTLAFLVLVNDMFSQRDYTVSSHRQVSPTISNILNMYAKNHVG